MTFKSLFITLLLITTAINASAHETFAVDQIQVTGVGEVNSEPDQVVLAVSVYAVEADQSKAKQNADRAYRALLDLISEQGIQDTDIKLTQLTMSPEYQWEDKQRQYRGERVSRTLSITVNDLTNLSALLQGLVEQGVSEIKSMQAGFQDSAAIKQQALANAVSDAQQKAEFLAKKLGRSVGAAMQVVEQNIDVPMFARQEMAMSRSMAASTPAPEMLGMQTIRANINITFRLR